MGFCFKRALVTACCLDCAQVLRLAGITAGGSGTTCWRAVCKGWRALDLTVDLEIGCCGIVIGVLTETEVDGLQADFATRCLLLGGGIGVAREKEQSVSC